jgi:hypothetical protein
MLLRLPLKQRWIGFSEDDGKTWRRRRIAFANALRTTRSTYKSINSRTYFTGGLP